MVPGRFGQQLVKTYIAFKLIGALLQFLFRLLEDLPDLGDLRSVLHLEDVPQYYPFDVKAGPRQLLRSHLFYEECIEEKIIHGIEDCVDNDWSSGRAFLRGDEAGSLQSSERFTYRLTADTELAGQVKF